MSFKKFAISALDFVVSRFFMKLFKTNDINIVEYCQHEFNFNIPSDVVAIRCERFKAIGRVTTVFAYICEIFFPCMQLLKV